MFLEPDRRDAPEVEGVVRVVTYRSIEDQEVLREGDEEQVTYATGKVGGWKPVAIWQIDSTPSERRAAYRVAGVAAEIEYRRPVG